MNRKVGLIHKKGCSPAQPTGVYCFLEIKKKEEEEEGDVHVSEFGLGERSKYSTELHPAPHINSLKSDRGEKNSNVGSSVF